MIPKKFEYKKTKGTNYYQTNKEIPQKNIARVL